MEFAVDLQVFENGKRAPQWTLDSDLGGQLSLKELLEFTKASLIVIADQALKEEQARGFDENPVRVVDGVKGKSELDVSPLGRIEYFSRVQSLDILSHIYAGIMQRAPVLTGEYKDSNYVFLNGRQIATNEASLAAWIATNPAIKPGDIIRFVNIAPYARKLERYGVTAQRRQSRTVKSRDPRGRSGFSGRIYAPNGTYFLTAKSITRKFEFNSKIRFGFIPGSLLGLTAAFKTANIKNKSGKPAKQKLSKPGRTYLYPSISVIISKDGVL